MNIVAGFPLTAILLIIYNIMAFSGDMNAKLANPLWSVTLLSGAEWTLTWSELLIVMGIVFLYVELVKATRTGSASIIDHVFSLLVFIIFLVEFIAVAGCGTSTFLILGLIALLDVVAGFTISIVSARRDFAVGPGVGG
ncbi:MAG: hypothetical protein AB7N71_09455 [Phycisphaerae bacterium]